MNRKMVFEKQEIGPMVEFLQELSLKNKISRLRNKLIKNMKELIKELEEDRVELCKEHSEKDEDGEAVVLNDEYKVIDMEALNKDIIELFEEKVTINSGEYSNDYSPLFDFLDSSEFDEEMSGIKANRYDLLLSVWEDAEEQENEER